jgi:ABC-type nitrate/sulfonate/bicarbonate transport system substrate-binding protein
MRLTRKAATVGTALFALTAMVTLAACSDSNAPTVVNLAGNYTVTGIGQGAPGVPPVVQPITGTAVLTATNYTIDIPPITTVSAGVYVALSDGTFTQDGTYTLGGGVPVAVQCAGTYTYVGNVLTIDTVCVGQRTITTFTRI